MRRTHESAEGSRRLGLIDPEARTLPEADRNEGVLGTRRHSPPPTLCTARGIEQLIEVRVNNLILEPGRMEKGWLLFPVEPKQIALGENLIGVRVTERPSDSADPISIEKLELSVDYR